MEKKYAEALYAYEEKQEKNDTLEVSYQAILEKMELYDVNLVDNYEFLEWIVADWVDTFEAQ